MKLTLISTGFQEKKQEKHVFSFFHNFFFSILFFFFFKIFSFIKMSRRSLNSLSDLNKRSKRSSPEKKHQSTKYSDNQGTSLSLNFSAAQQMSPPKKKTIVPFSRKSDRKSVPKHSALSTATNRHRVTQEEFTSMLEMPEPQTSEPSSLGQSLFESSIRLRSLNDMMNQLLNFRINAPLALYSYQSLLDLLSAASKCLPDVILMLLTIGKQMIIRHNYAQPKYLHQLIKYTKYLIANKFYYESFGANQPKAQRKLKRLLQIFEEHLTIPPYGKEGMFDTKKIEDIMNLNRKRNEANLKKELERRMRAKSSVSIRKSRRSEIDMDEIEHTEIMDDFYDIEGIYKKIPNNNQEQNNKNEEKQEKFHFTFIQDDSIDNLRSFNTNDNSPTDSSTKIKQTLERPPPLSRYNKHMKSSDDFFKITAHPPRNTDKRNQQPNQSSQYINFNYSPSNINNFSFQDPNNSLNENMDNEDVYSYKDTDSINDINAAIKARFHRSRKSFSGDKHLELFLQRNLKSDRSNDSSDNFYRYHQGKTKSLLDSSEDFMNHSYAPSNTSRVSSLSESTQFHIDIMPEANIPKIEQERIKLKAFDPALSSIERFFMSNDTIYERRARGSKRLDGLTQEQLKQLYELAGLFVNWRTAYSSSQVVWNVMKTDNSFDIDVLLSQIPVSYGDFLVEALTTFAQQEGIHIKEIVSPL